MIVQRAPGVKGAGYWAPVSGRVEPGESQAEAVVREVREEVGLDVRALRKVWECPTWDATYTLHWWLTEYTGGEVAVDPDEVSAARWMSVEAFINLEPTWEDDRRFFAEVYPKVRGGTPKT